MLNAWLLRLRETSRLGSRCAESSTVDVYVYLGDFAGAEWTPISTHIQEAFGSVPTDAIDNLINCKTGHISGVGANFLGPA